MSLPVAPPSPPSPTSPPLSSFSRHPFTHSSPLHLPISSLIACNSTKMAQTYTTPDDWLLTHHARDADISSDSSAFTTVGIQKDHSVPIDTLFRSRRPRQIPPPAPTSPPLAQHATPTCNQLPRKDQKLHPLLRSRSFGLN